MIIGLDKIMSIEEVERRWRENPLDTTYPTVPWWHRSRWCRCSTAAVEHSPSCEMNPIFGLLKWQLIRDAWPLTWAQTQEHSFCGECAKRLGEINGPMHFCQSAHQITDARWEINEDDLWD